MPLDPLVKNKGPLLISKIRGSVDDFPNEFVSKLGKDIYAQPVPLDIEPLDLTGLLLESRILQERTNERKRVDTYFGGAGPNGNGSLTIEDIVGTALVTRVLLPDGQIGTRTRSLQAEGYVFPANELTDSADQRNLGNGWLDQVIVTKPTVFPKRVRTTELPDLVPVEFRAFLKTHVSEDTLIGTITSPPVLGANEFVRSEEELDVFTFRRKTSARDAVSLPFVITGNKRTNRYKQVETVSHILDADTVTPTLPSSTRDVTFTKLGNGLAVQEIVDVPVAFERLVASIEIPNVIPAEFRTDIPLFVYERTLAGTVSVPPVLGPDELSRSDEQVDDFNFRRRSTVFEGITFPRSRTDHEITSEFGGGILAVVRTLDDADMAVAGGLTVVSSSTRQLAPALFLNETKYLPSGTWPTLKSLRYDEEIQDWITEETQVVAPSYIPVTGTYFFEHLKAIDQWKAQRVRVTKQPPATGVANAIVTYEYRPFQFPGLIYLAPSGLGYYERKASAQLCKHTLRTWWVVSAGPPVIAVDEIITDRIIISELNNTSTLAYSGDCLHDAITTFGTFVYAATTPSKTDYVTSWIGVEKVVAATVTRTDVPGLWKVVTQSVVMR